MHSFTLRLFYPFLSCCIALSPADVPAQTKSTPADDVQDILFLGDQYPVFIRLHVHVNGRSYKAAWRRYVNRVFFDLDRDGDDVLSEGEAHGIDAKHRPQPQREIVREGDVFRPPPPKRQMLPADASPQDGRITREELLAYFSEQSSNLFSVQSRPTVSQFADSGSIENSGNTLLERVDRDGNGLVSREELNSLRESLFQYDWNDDEVLTKEELVPPAGAAMDVPRMNAPPTNNGDRIVAVSAASDVQLGLLLSRVFARYDESATKYDPTGIEPLESAQRLDRGDMGWTAERFARIDRDGDGRLDRDEFQALLQDPQPAIELILRRGRRAPDEPAVELVAIDDDLLPTRPKVVVQDDWFSLVIGGSRLEFQGTDPAETSTDVAGVFQQQFNALDADNNGYLEVDEIENGAFFQESQFRQMDGDADGKLFQKEMLAYLAEQREAAASRTVLFVAERGRDLFELFDVDGDAQLGVRELMAAPERLASYDQNGDGQLASGEVPERIQLSLGAGQPAGLPGFAVAFNPAATVSTTPRRVDAPEWFQRMDTNSDGDLSPREFLGPLDKFKKLDTDGDGLIAADEAAAAK